MIPEHLELDVQDFGFAVRSVEEQEQLEVLEWPG